MAISTTSATRSIVTTKSFRYTAVEFEITQDGLGRVYSRTGCPLLPAGCQLVERTYNDHCIYFIATPSRLAELRDEYDLANRLDCRLYTKSAAETFTPQPMAAWRYQVRLANYFNLLAELWLAHATISGLNAKPSRSRKSSKPQAIAA